MALTRKLLKGMGLTDEQVDTIIEAHTDTVDGLKADVTRYKADAEKLPGVQKQLDDLKAAGDGGYKEKYEKEHSAFEAFKTDITAKESKAAKEKAVRAYFESKNITGANLDLAMRGCVEEMAALEMDGDKIIALLAMTMKEKGRLDGDTAVVTVMSNLGFIKYMEAQGINTEKTAVGDRYVLENMRENGFAIGGEQSGHVILLHHATTGDGELTAGKLLKLLAESGKKMSELNGIYAQYPQVLVNVAANAAQKAAYKEDKVLADFIENEEQKLMDMGRVLVRVSGTEPKIRVMVEGQDLEAIDLCAKRIVDKINERIIEG